MSRQGCNQTNSRPDSTASSETDSLLGTETVSNCDRAKACGCCILCVLASAGLGAGVLIGVDKLFALAFGGCEWASPSVLAATGGVAGGAGGCTFWCSRGMRPHKETTTNEKKTDVIALQPVANT